jgi:hypothetical protein
MQVLEFFKTIEEICKEHLSDEIVSCGNCPIQTECFWLFDGEHIITLDNIAEQMRTLINKVASEKDRLNLSEFF